MPRSRLRSRDGLPREAAFVREFPKDFNLTKAAIRAEYSSRTAHVQGSQILGRLRVRAALDAHLAALARRADVSAERVLRELAAVGFSDMRDFASWTRRAVRLTPSAALPDGAAACVQEVSAWNGGVIRIRLHDRGAALEQLARHLRLFPTSRVALRGGGAAGATEGQGRVVVYVPDNGRDPELALPPASGNGRAPSRPTTGALPADRSTPPRWPARTLTRAVPRFVMCRHLTRPVPTTCARHRSVGLMGVAKATRHHQLHQQIQRGVQHRTRGLEETYHG